MKRSAKNYLMIMGIFFSLYFLVLCILAARETMETSALFSSPASLASIILWLVLIFVLACAAGGLCAWMYLSRANGLDIREALKTVQDRMTMIFACLGAGCISMLGIISIQAAAGPASSSAAVLQTSSNLVILAPEEDEEEEQTSTDTPVSAGAAQVDETADSSTDAAEADAQEDTQQGDLETLAGVEVIPFPIPELPPVKPQKNLAESYESVTVVNDVQTLEGSYKSDEADKNLICAKDGGQASLISATLVKSGTQSDPLMAFQYGTNAALMAGTSGTVNMMGGRISTSAQGAPGLSVSGSGASASVSDAVIQTYGSISPAVFAGFSGQAHLVRDQLYTQAASSPIVYIRSGSSISADSVIAQSSGTESAVFENAGTFSAVSLNANALNSVFARLYSGSDTTLTSSNTSALCGGSAGQAMFLFTPSEGSAKTAPASLNLQQTRLVINENSPYLTSTSLCYVDGVSASITMSQCSVDTYPYLVKAVNGSSVTFNLSQQIVSGALLADASSALNVSVQAGSLLEGSINKDNACPQVSVSVDAQGSLSLTGDLYCASFANADTTNANIRTNGYHIFVNGTQVL